ncbi:MULTISPECIES: phospholipase D-like domain-containing protein [Bacillales]|uniref:phospholipase D-like domain-containing protein n=1 Tax=Bacillales TaxID=1385 RepID=UPI002162A7B1|nr:phospholipase D-like domain-containing protein [Lysinibacillus boronitolerans]MCS1390269.1 hypothetical protein [Lysinibacillus boronitolerans]
MEWIFFLYLLNTFFILFIAIWEVRRPGVQIYQYNKGMLHAKLMIIDEEIAEVGAANYDI